MVFVSVIVGVPVLVAVLVAVLVIAETAVAVLVSEEPVPDVLVAVGLEKTGETAIFFEQPTAKTAVKKKVSAVS